MELTGLGGGLMLAIAAGLWLVYLVPNWLKRREYLATERNAVRLQQTIRVLAETAEVPAEVRREAAARQLAYEQRADLTNGPVAVGRPVSKPVPIPDDPRSLAAKRLRRGRVLSAFVLLGSVIVIVAQSAIIVASGAFASSWLILATAVLAGVGAITMLRRLADISRARREVTGERPARRTSLGRALRAEPAGVVPEASEPWTPVAVPKPRYLERSFAPSVTVDVSELEAAAASAESALRAATAEATPIASAAEAQPAEPSRFASMGIIDASASATPDIDAVLARRRAAG
jgi:hypothetical protein